MAYSTLRLGSTGEEVKKLQQTLQSAGYDLGSSGADGIYGSKTAGAVQAYQRDMGLTEDGIAGAQTLGRLYKTDTGTDSQQTQQSQAQPTVKTATAYDPAKDTSYQAALEKLTATQAQAPTYKGSFDRQLQDIYEKIMGREDFHYDLNEDALWQQYKDQYTQGGRMAMMDTVGQAAALTGGYGSSYAQQVGQQTYNQYLQGLNEKIPELYQLAQSRYAQEGEALAQQYAMTGDMAADEYGRYQDAYSQWLNQLGLAREDEQRAYDRGQTQWQTQYGIQQDNYDRLSSLITSTGYTPDGQELAAAGMSEGEAAALRQYYTQASAPSYSTSGSTGSAAGTGDGSESGILSAMLALGDDTAAWDYLMSSGLNASLATKTWEQYEAQKSIGAGNDLWEGLKTGVSGVLNKLTGGGTGQQTASAGVKGFQSRIMSEQEFINRKKQNSAHVVGDSAYDFDSYKEYLEAMLDSYSSSLTDEELAELIKYYGL